MSRTVKIVLILISILASIICVCCGLYIFQYFRGNMLHSETEELVRPSQAIAITPSTPSIEADTSPSDSSDPAQESEPATVPSVIDFDALWAINEEIYAWIEVPGTNINYAVVQSATNDLYYNNHNIDKSYFSGGSIYSQRYNTKDFQDPMTLLYGHNLQSGTMFAQVNNFYDTDFFNAAPYIYIYTPEKVYLYEIFAAYPHSSEHLLLCYDFSEQEQFSAYFEGLSDTIDSNYRRDLFPEFGDKVITLSTCYRSNRLQRYLVQGVLTAEYSVEQP